MTDKPSDKTPDAADEDADLKLQPPAGESPASAQAALWYSARPGGSQEGPYTFAALKKKAAEGEIGREDLVWKEGMPVWVAAHSVDNLFTGVAAEKAPPKLPPPSPAPRRDDPMKAVAGGMKNPSVYLMAGMAFAGLSALLFFLSGILWLVSRWQWFTGAVVFLLAAVVCVAASAILKSLAGIETRLEELSTSKKNRWRED